MKALDEIPILRIFKLMNLPGSQRYHIDVTLVVSLWIILCTTTVLQDNSRPTLPFQMMPRHLLFYWSPLYLSSHAASTCVFASIKIHCIGHLCPSLPTLQVFLMHLQALKSNALVTSVLVLQSPSVFASIKIHSPSTTIFNYRVLSQ